MRAGRVTRHGSIAVAVLVAATTVVGPAAAEPVPATAGAGDHDVTPRRGAAAPTRATPADLKPRLVDKPIPFGHKRKRQMGFYSKRHYGDREHRLRSPRVIVEHYTDGPSMMSAWWTMANNAKNLGERPGVCTHFIIDTDGRIYRVVPLRLRCRHTIGLNFTAVGIEHVGSSDRQVMRNDRQRRASMRLTLWLMAKFDIPVRNVIGHGESLLSPLRAERYRSWKCLTHTDFSHHTMHRYRDRLRDRAHAQGVRAGPRPAWVDIGC